MLIYSGNTGFSPTLKTFLTVTLTHGRKSTHPLKIFAVQRMKEIHHSSALICVALIVLTGLPRLASAADFQYSDLTSEGFGKNQNLLAEASASGAKKEPAKGPIVNVDKKGVILKGYDAVAYFKNSRAVKGSAKYASSYGGATYRFASAENKADFDKAPAKYSPQYGGFCANSLSKGKLADIDPTQFMIFKGKLYVCSSEQGLKAFGSKPDVNIPKADKNWQNYQPPSNPGFRRELGS